MYINTMLIGTDFVLNNDQFLSATGEPLYSIPDTHELYQAHKDHYDKRTGYLCTSFTPATPDAALEDLTWYNNYMYLNYVLLATFMQSNPGKQIPVLNMLNNGYIPIGYAPSFMQDVNPFFVRLLELRKVPYVLYRATVMSSTFYKTDTKDVWTSKLDLAKYLGCAPENVTFTSALGGLLSHG